VTGRENFAALPRSPFGILPREKESAKAADNAFGHRMHWESIMRKNIENEKLEEELVASYKRNLRRWFRFVQPLPFVPKTGQRYDLFCCSNFDTGMKVINQFYERLTGIDFTLDADNSTTYSKFIRRHPDLRMSGNRRPDEWKCLWHVLKNHVDGICDQKCQGGIRKLGGSFPESKLSRVLKWLHDNRYLKQIPQSPTYIPWMWPNHDKFPVYSVDWDFVKTFLDVDPPKSPEPLKPDDIIPLSRSTRPPTKKPDKRDDEFQTKLEDF
jgi:hypothetical protein